MISLKKDPNWSPRSHYARTPPRCQNTPFGMYMWGKLQHLTFEHFWPTFEPDSPKWNFDFFGKKCIFNEENTNEFAEMLRSDKIPFFSIWAVTTSFWATKVIDTWKNWIFSQFLEFLNFGRFSPLLTQFWISNAGAGFVIFYNFSNRYFTFPTQTRSKVVKIEQNLKIRKIEKKSSFLTPWPLS